MDGWMYIGCTYTCLYNERLDVCMYVHVCAMEHFPLVAEKLSTSIHHS